MARKKMYSFVEKRHSQRGFLSAILGVLSLVIFFVMVYLAFYYGGQGGAYLGAFGFTGAVLAFTGLVLGLVSFNERDTIYTFSKIGSILNGCVTAIWLIIILLGLS